jgi:AraC-like DNA-binding protein
MKTDKDKEFPKGDYAPHILSGAEARRQSGRRAPGPARPSGVYPWYTTYMIDQGPFTLIDPEQGKQTLEGPAVICLPPLPDAKVLIPSSTLFSWLEWGAIRLPLRPREQVNASRKYEDGYQQPQPEDVWGRPMPLRLPDRCNRPTAEMMVRVNAFWWKGGLNRMQAEAELALWIATCLFPPVLQEHERVTDLFPETDASFQDAVQFLQNSLGMGVDIQDWAAGLGLLPRTLQRWCRRETGQKPQEILNTLRLRTATRLLKSTDLTLHAISKQCGFSSAPAFSLWFSQKTGQSPSKWRKANPV